MHLLRGGALLSAPVSADQAHDAVTEIEMDHDAVNIVLGMLEDVLVRAFEKGFAGNKSALADQVTVLCESARRRLRDAGELLTDVRKAVRS